MNLTRRSFVLGSLGVTAGALVLPDPIFLLERKKAYSFARQLRVPGVEPEIVVVRHNYAVFGDDRSRAGRGNIVQGRGHVHMPDLSPHALIHVHSQKLPDGTFCFVERTHDGFSVCVAGYDGKPMPIDCGFEFLTMS